MTDRREDKVLAREYTGPDSAYCGEIYMYGQAKGDRLGVAPLTPWAAIDIAMQLLALAFRALRTPRVLK